MRTLLDIIKGIISSTRQIDILTFHWFWPPDPAPVEAWHEFVPVSIGWGCLFIATTDGQPFLGIEISPQHIAVWCGRVFRIHWS